MDRFSLSVAQLELFGKKSGEKRSGEWMLPGHAVQLITNWHVVTGVDPTTMQPVDPREPLPNAMRIFFKVGFTKEGGGSGWLNTHSIDVPLYVGDEAIWSEHSTRQNVDVVAFRLDITQFANFANQSINTLEQESRLPAYAGMDCYVLGHPEGMIGPGRTPIWKRGSIATEPDYDFRNMRGFLIDTATRSGMSGSPVIVRHSGIFNPSGAAHITPDAVIGTVSKFVGIYSGRLGDDPMEVQLGMVWRAEVLEDIVTGNTKGFNPCRT